MHRIPGAIAAYTWSFGGRSLQVGQRDNVSCGVNNGRGEGLRHGRNRILQAATCREVKADEGGLNERESEVGRKNARWNGELT